MYGTCCFHWQIISHILNGFLRYIELEKGLIFCINCVTPNV
jgi:hypothetical protein